jgi:hypothetical protein
VLSSAAAHLSENGSAGIGMHQRRFKLEMQNGENA